MDIYSPPSNAIDIPILLRLSSLQKIAASSKDEKGIPILRRLETTDEHFFWVTDENRWMAARNLTEGDTLSMPNGQEAEVTEIWRLESPATVYSFDVDEYESFYANGVLVRQKCGGAEETAVEQRLREIINDKGESQMPPFEGKRSEGGVP